MKQFGELFSTYEKSAFRIETLDQYLVDGEQECFELYKNGVVSPPSENEAWAESIREMASQGKEMARVHIVSRDVSPYVRFETDWYYRYNSVAGEDIRILYRDRVPEDITFTDTWLFDDRIVVDMSYTSDGELLYINKNEHPDRLTQAREAWSAIRTASISLEEFLSDLRRAPIHLD